MIKVTKPRLPAYVIACLLLFAGSARAQPPTPLAATLETVPKPKPKYSLPWALRPAIAPNVLRSDSSLALQDTGTAFVSTVLGGAKLVPDFGLYGKIAITHNAPDASPPKAATTISNALLFGLFTPELAKGLRLPIALGVTLPFGMGGGNDQDKNAYAAQAASILARSAMDNALFAVNYLTVTGGVGLAWIYKRLTLQGEATVLQLMRVRGDKVEKDESRTNFTGGFHAGVAVIDMLTLSAEARYQRWLSDPAYLKVDPTKRDQLTVGGGVRLNLPVGKVQLRPGFAYFQGVDDPMAKLKYRVLTFDIPVAF